MDELDISKRIGDQVPIGVLVLDAKHIIRYWNRWLTDQTGVDEEHAIGRTLDELFPNINTSRFLWGIEHVITTKSPQVMSQALNRFLIPIQIEHTDDHGLSKMQQHVHIAPLVGDDGEVLAVVSIIDVTLSIMRSSALVEMAQKLQHASNRDPLTTLYNRRFMWEWLVQQLKQCARYGHPLSCLMMDIDHFKHINDTYGHDRGDQVLKSFARIVTAQLRNSDILVRYGGEEFVALVPHCDLQRAVQLAERIRVAVCSVTHGSLNRDRISCSIGVVCNDRVNPMTGMEMLKQADKRLYEAKDRGRNQVMPPLDTMTERRQHG